MRKRSIVHQVRVTKEEKRKFLKLAESRHTTLADLVREILHREADTSMAKAGPRK